MKRPFQTLPWGHMKKSMLRFGVLISLFAGLMQLSCKNDDRQELFELNFPPPPIEFDILPGLNTFDTHIYSFSPIPTIESIPFINCTLSTPANSGTP